MRFTSHVAICLAAQVVLAVSAADAAGGRPSEGDIRACVANTEQGRVYGAVLRFEFGKTFTSQGGMIEMAMGAPQGTPIFPTKLYFPGGWVGVAWIFQDPFGAWKCVRNGDMKKGPDPERQAALDAKPRSDSVMQARIAALETTDCTNRPQGNATDLIPFKTKRVFTVSPLKECWTNWLAIQGKPFGISCSGKILVQYLFREGGLGPELEQAPGETTDPGRAVQAVRFKSLRREPVSVTLRAK